jgi:LysM repeat protein
MSGVTLASRMRRVVVVMSGAAVVAVMMALPAVPAMAEPVITDPAGPVTPQPIVNNDLGLASLDMAPVGAPADAHTHVVQPGETLSGIAATLGTTTEGLAAANGLSNPHLIFPGQALRH